METFTARDWRGEFKTLAVKGRKVFSAEQVALLVHDGEYIVVYGLEVTDCGDYADAAHTLGESLMHMLACEGLLPDE